MAAAPTAGSVSAILGTFGFGKRNPIDAAKSLPGAFRNAVTGPILGAPRAAVRTTGNLVSRGLGNGTIDASVYENDRASRFADKTIDYVPYMIPGVNVAYAYVGLTDLAAGLASDPKGTLKGLGESVNVLESGLKPEDRFLRAVNLVTLLHGAARFKGGLTDAATARTLSRELGMDSATAWRAAAAGRRQLAEFESSANATRLAREGRLNVVREGRVAQGGNDLKVKVQLAAPELKHALLRPGSVRDVVDASVAARVGDVHGFTPLESGVLVKAARGVLEAKGKGTALPGEDGIRGEFRARTADVADLAGRLAKEQARRRVKMPDVASVAEEGIAPPEHDPYVGKALRPGTNPGQLALGWQGMDRLRAASG